MRLLRMRQQGTDADHSAHGPLRRIRTARCGHAQGGGKQSAMWLHAGVGGWAHAGLGTGASQRRAGRSAGVQRP